MREAIKQWKKGTVDWGRHLGNTWSLLEPEYEMDIWRFVPQKSRPTRYIITHYVKSIYFNQQILGCLANVLLISVLGTLRMETEQKSCAHHELQRPYLLRMVELSIPLFTDFLWILTFHINSWMKQNWPGIGWNLSWTEFRYSWERWRMWA
jgi:hypothetical protein